MKFLLHSMGFDPYAMVNPRTREDVILLLNEALAELAHINDLLDIVFEKCQKDLDNGRNT